MASTDPNFTILKNFSNIADPRQLIDFYLSHQTTIRQKLFLNNYLNLVGNSTEECYTNLAEWYANTIVLPILNEGEIEDAIIKSQATLEKDFIEKNLIDNCTLLDVGCGPGRIPFTFYSNPKIKEILAFDISRTMLNKAKEVREQFKGTEKITFFRGDIVNLQKLHLEGPVVATCMFGTIGNIPREEDRVTALNNIRNNIPYGKLLLSVFNMDKISEGRKYYKKTVEGYGENLVELKSDCGEKTYFFSPVTKFFSTWFTKEGILAELEKAGLKAKVVANKELLLIKYEKEGKNGTRHNR